MSTAGVGTLEQRMTSMEIAFAKVETKLDELIRQSEPRGVDVEARLRKLEASRWWAMGAAATVGAIVGWVAPFINH